ncbi:MAG: MATE family efflux transporter [Oscillospiraceae bacterium]|nr:MATE family efflux transporter [Oscillospiraceae bacterium]
MKRTDSDPQARYIRMTTQPIPSLIVSMAVPAICSQIVTSLYNLADTYFVGSIGTSATAAPGVAMPLLMIIQAVSLMLAMGAGSLAARQLGARQEEDANRTVSTAFFLSVMVGTVIGAFSLAALEPIMVICGATPTILPYACDYAFWIILATPFYSATFVLSAVVRQEGNVRLSVIGTVAGAVVNCILDPILIFVFDLGIVGAAAATSLSQIVSFGILFSHMVSGRCVLKLGWRCFSLRWRVLWEIFKVGAPDLFRNGLLSVANILLNNAAAVYGDAPLAGMGIVTKLVNVLVMMLMGFGQGYQPMCGYCFGAKLYGRVKEGLWFSLRVCLTAMAALSAAAYLLAPGIIAVFRGDDPAVIEVGSRILRAHVAVLPLATVTVIANMLFQSCGRAAKSGMIALSRNGLLLIPMILYLPRAFQLDGVIWAQPAADVLTFAAALLMLLHELARLRALERQAAPAGAGEVH